MSHVVVDNPHGLDQQVSTFSCSLFLPYKCGDFPLRTCSFDRKGASLAKSLAFSYPDAAPGKMEVMSL